MLQLLGSEISKDRVELLLSLSILLSVLSKALAQASLVV